MLSGQRLLLIKGTQMNIGLVWLFCAIFMEVVATSFLKLTEGFTRLVPTVLVLSAYGVSFYFLSQTIKTVPTGIAYAIWSGVGIVCINLLAWMLYGQKLDFPATLGITLITVGVLCIQLFSKVSTH